MKRLLRLSLFIYLLPLIALIFLFAASVADSAADDTSVVKVAFKQAEYKTTLATEETGKVRVDVIVSAEEGARRTGDIAVTYEVSSDDGIMKDLVKPWGEQELTIPVEQSYGLIALTVDPHDNWGTGIKEVELKIKAVSSSAEDETVVLGEIKEMILIIGREEKRQYLPSIHSHSAGPQWAQFTAGGVDTSGRSLAACPADSAILYLGTDDGLFKWNANKWDKVASVPGSVREITFGVDCNHVYAAVFGEGVWGTANGVAWALIGPAHADRESVLTVAVRGNWLYAGTNTGVHYYDLGAGGQWRQVDSLKGKIITRLAAADSRLFAAVWEQGVSYNDVCDASQCAWTGIPGPDNDKFIRDVISRSPQTAGVKPDWILLATSTTVYWLQEWDGATKATWVKADRAPQPTGNVFSLAADRDFYYAGIENGGVWMTGDGGRNWYPVGDESDTVRGATIRDIIVPQPGTIYAATFNNGVWRWPLPPTP